MTSASDDICWTFEYTGNGKEFLVHDENGQYLIINNDNISLGNRENAAQKPIVVEYDNSKDRYALKAKDSDQALNNYGASGFGRWKFDANNQDFWMQLRSPYTIGKPGTIGTADTRSEGIIINLFDYGPDSLDLEGNTVNKLTNEGINNNHPLKFVSHGTEGTTMNHYTGGTNGSGADGTQYRAMQGIVQPALSGGYPVLTGYTATNGGSLQYLFDPTTSVNGKTSYGDVNHLFIKDERGYYEYDSNMNYAYYDTSSANSDRDFKVYANSFDEEGTVKNEKVGFFPFNDYDSYYNCIHGGKPNDQEGFGYYSPHWNGSNHTHSGLNKLGHYNHHFGMSMTADFVMTADGRFNDRDMTFSFSGDDDMWVFVDGVLVLDIGGIHNPVSGSINFRTGDVTVSGAKTVDSAGAQAGPISLTEAFNRVPGKSWDATPYSSHKLQVFYLERGGMYSNCKIGFNLPTYKTLSLSKRLTGLTDAERSKYKNETFRYEVVVNGQLYNGSDTVRLDASGKVLEQGFSITNGQVSIKDGETVTIIGLKPTDTFYAAEEKSLNMELFEVPHAERNYLDNDQIIHEEEITLIASHAQGANLDDWATPTYLLENTEKVTFTNALKEKDLEVDKKWVGEGTHPDQVKFTVSALVENDDGSLIPYAASVLKDADGTTDKEFSLSESNNWRAIIEHLPVQDPKGKPIVYDIKEAHVEGYVSSAQDLTAEAYNYCNVDAVKLWLDDRHADEIITVKLRNGSGQFYAGTDAQGNAVFNANGTAFNLTKDNNYTHRFARVPFNDTYTVVQSGDQDDHTKGLVSYIRNIVQLQLTNTPIGQQVDPSGPRDNPEIHKRIDALRDGTVNPDSAHTDEDLTDLYRLYLDYKVNSLQEASSVDLLFVIDHSGSMNNPDWQGNPNRAPAVMQALNGEDGLISQFLNMSEKNQWAAVGFKGPDGAMDYRWSFAGAWPPRTSTSAYNAGENGSEVLSPGGTSYAFTRNANNNSNKVYVSLPNEGANILTNYTAGLWRAEQFLLKDDVKSDGRKKVVVFISDGIPTLHIDCPNKTLTEAGNADGSYYYRDDYGGCPTQTLTEFGYFVNDMTQNGYTFGDNMEFYTIGFGGSMQTAAGGQLLTGMLDIAYGADGHDGHFMTINDPTSSSDEGSAKKLKEDLRTIMGMNETFSNIVIQDDLSKYVDLFKSEGETDLLKSAKAKVTMTDPDDPTKTVVLWENGSAANDAKAKFTKANGTQAPIISRLEYDESKKLVKAVFDPEYEAVAGITYTLSFDVIASDEAYSTFMSAGYDQYTSGNSQGHVIVGDADTDFQGTDPANTTSSGKPGFRSNDSATASYKHNDTVEQKEYPHPVIQAFKAEIHILKTDQEGKPLEGAKFKLYKDAYVPEDTEEVREANAANQIGEEMESKLKENGTEKIAEIAVKDLRPGLYYLVETYSPDGYIKSAPVRIEVKVKTIINNKVSQDNVVVTASVGGNDLIGDKLVKTDDYWVMKVVNSTGATLPATGGPGTTLFYVTGIGLIALAVLLLLRKREKELR